MKTLRLIFAPMLILLFVCAGLSFAQSMDPITSRDEVVATNGSMDDSTPPVTLSESAYPMAKTLAAQWSTGTKLPIAKKYHAVASLNGEMYIFAGVTTGNVYNAKSYKYSPMTSTWSPIADFPLSQYVMAQAQAVNGKIYIFAGLSNTNPLTISLVMYEYDPATNVFTKKKNIPIAQSQAVSGVLDNKIYLIAGYTIISGTGQYSNLVQVYDPATDTWSTATNYPIAARYLSAATVQNKIVVSGGFNNTPPATYFYKADTYVGELVSGSLSWKKGKDYPIGPTIFMSGVGIGNHGIFFGGRPSIDNNAPATKYSFKYDPQTDTWASLERKPTGMQTLIQAGTDGQKAYALGGEDASVLAMDVNEILDPNAAGGPAFILTESSILVPLKKGVTLQRSYTIKNNGSADLTWNGSITPTSNWVSLSPVSGTVPPYSTSKVQLQFKTDAINSGTYNAALALTTNDPANATANIPITLYVQDQEVDTDMIALLEEGTGNWCQYCPYGADSVDATLKRYPGRVLAIAYHGGSTTEPMQIPATNTWAQQVGLQGWPSASVNRIKFEGEANISFVDRALYAGKTAEVLATRRSPVSLNIVAKQYNPGTKQGSLTVEVFFHQPMNANIRLNVAQLEDDLNWTQIFAGTPTKIYPYYHKHVIRQLLPSDFGEVVTTGTNVASQTAISKTISFTSKDSVAAKSSFIIFAHISDGVKFGEVLQSKAISLTSLTDVSMQPTPTEFALSQNFPNPFNPTTTISYSLPTTAHVTLKVTDMLGREVQTIVNEKKDAGVHYAAFNASAIPSGLYLYTINAGTFNSTKQMIVVK